jgi:hypothetical protein
MELIEHLPTDTLPRCGGLSATIVVTIDYAGLVSGLGAAGLDTGGSISASEARRLACDAGIIPLVLGGDSMPLDVGRERRFHTRYQRIALAQRDGGCSAEGCDRPPGWTEAHHETPWAGGGATNVEQGRLLCSWHHHVAHDRGYTAQRQPTGGSASTDGRGPGRGVATLQARAQVEATEAADDQVTSGRRPPGRGPARPGELEGRVDALGVRSRWAW